MSLLPIETINAYRKNVDTLIEMYGMDCVLHVAKNVEQRDRSQIYAEQPGLQYHDPIDTKVWIVWNPNMKWLRNMGIFTEEELPIVGFARSDHQITRLSYVKINMGYAIGDNQTEEFEFVDHVVKKAYDAVVVAAWKLAPRRRG